MIRIEKSIQDIAYPSPGFRQVNLSDSPPPYNSQVPPNSRFEQRFVDTSCYLSHSQPLDPIQPTHPSFVPNFYASIRHKTNKRDPHTWIFL